MGSGSGFRWDGLTDHPYAAVSRPDSRCRAFGATRRPGSDNSAGACTGGGGELSISGGEAKVRSGAAPAACRGESSRRSSRSAVLPESQRPRPPSQPDRRRARVQRRPGVAPRWPEAPDHRVGNPLPRKSHCPRKSCRRRSSCSQERCLRCNRNRRRDWPAPTRVRSWATLRVRGRRPCGATGNRSASSHKTNAIGTRPAGFQFNRRSRQARRSPRAGGTARRRRSTDIRRRPLWARNTTPPGRPGYRRRRDG